MTRGAVPGPCAGPRVQRAARRAWRVYACALLVGVLGVHLPHALRQGEAAPERIDHVVLVVLGGGVRPDDLAHRERMPTLAAWVAAGEAARVDRIASGARSLDEALVRLLSGHAEAEQVEGALRPRRRTLLERTGGWFVSTPGGASLAPATSRAPTQPGRAPPGRFAYGAGAFGEPLAPFLEALGRPVPLEGRAFGLLEGLRAVHRAEAALRLPPDVRLGMASFERVERALLDELDRRALFVRGPNAEDLRALRMASTLLRVHRPHLLVVRLADAEVGSVAAAQQERVLAANDRQLGVLQAVIDADPQLGGRTALVVVTDRARRAEPEADGRLLEPLDAKEDGGAAAVLRFPGLRRRTPKGDRRLEDVTATLAVWLGLPPEAGGVGRAWVELGPR